MKNNDKIQNGRIYVIAENYNVAKAVGLSEKAFMNGKPQWIMKNYDGSTFFCSEENLLVASGEEVKSWITAFRANRDIVKFTALAGEAFREEQRLTALGG